MTIYLVRHAAAGNRSEWRDDDWLRPLSRKGHAQARGLVPLFHRASFTRIVSSPAVRCVETVAPLAGAHGIAIEINAALAEEADVELTLALLKEASSGGAVLCSHGDMIPAVLEHVRAQGVDLGPAPRCEKGSVWVLDAADGSVHAATYLPPPVTLP